MSAGHVSVSKTRLARWVRHFGSAVAMLPALSLWTLAVATHPPGGGPPWYLPAILLLLWAGPATWVASRMLGRRRLLGTREVRAQDGTLILEQDAGAPLRIARAEMDSAVIGATGIEIDLADGRRVDVTMDADRAREVLAALALGPGERRATFVWHGRGEAIGAALLGLFLPLLALAIFQTPAVGALTVPVLSGLPWLLAGWFGEIAARHAVTVGADGVELRQGGRREVVSFGEVREVRSSDRGLALALRDGRDVAVMSARQDAREREAMARWIQAALERSRARGEAGQRRVELPSARDAGFEAFRAAAAKTLATRAAFRHADVSAEDVAAVLEDATAVPEQRIAAAVALSASGEETARARVRVAAEASVHPRLRVALEAAANDELEEEMVRDASAEGRRRAGG